MTFKRSLNPALFCVIIAVMYKIMLVDDEEEVRKSIIQKISWERVGFEIAADAENAQDALEKLEATDPDVIITDIKMPFIDGLEFAQKAKEILPFVKIIIFSGYDEFSYAREAIKLNVFEYILKPVNVEELTQILERVKNNLDKELEEKRDVARMRENYMKSLPILRQQFLSDLIRGRAEEPAEKIAAYNLKLSGAEFSVAVFSVEPPKESNSSHLSFSLLKEKDLIPFSVKEIIDEKFSAYNFESFLCEGQIAVITSAPRVIYIAKEICAECKKILTVNVTAGIGKIHELPKISESYREACSALSYKAVLGAGAAIYIGDAEPAKKLSGARLTRLAESEFAAAVKFCDPNSAELLDEAVDKVCAPMENVYRPFNEYQVYLTAVLNALAQLAVQYDIYIEEIRNFITALPEIETTLDFAKWLKRAAKEINSQINRERESAGKEIVRNAKKIMETRFYDAELSIESIAKELNFSPAYFSTLFKKETGESAASYLANTRLNFAAGLLRGSDEKTYVVAQKSGYSETNYFSYSFKKKFGVSPTKYRTLI